MNSAANEDELAKLA